MEGAIMPIGMSSGMSNGFWNPRAKYQGPLSSNLRQLPQPSLNYRPYMGNTTMSPTAPMMQSPIGQQPEYPPISPTTDILSKHSILPNQMTSIQPQIDHARNPLNTPNRRMGTGVIRRMF